MQFYTKYKLKSRNERLYSAIDKVDRLSYLDTNQQIRSFINAGNSLTMARARALQGLYTGSEDDDFPSSPVYPVDPVDAGRMSEVLLNELQSRQVNKSATASEPKRSDGSNADADLKSVTEIEGS